MNIILNNRCSVQVVGQSWVDLCEEASSANDFSSIFGDAIPRY